MSVNSKYAINQDKVKRYGKLYGGIDFSVNSSLSTELIRTKKSDLVVGKFEIGGKEFPVTMAEINRIIETAESAKTVFNRSYGLGRFGY